MKKHTLLFILFVVCAINGMAQTHSVRFIYDKAGNRISKSILLPLAAPERKNANENETTEVYTDTFSEYNLLVYPNPTRGELKIELSNFPEGETYHLLIADASGQVIINQKVSENPTVANLTECPAGIYLMRLRYKGYTKDYKIIRL